MERGQLCSRLPRLPLHRIWFSPYNQREGVAHFLGRQLFHPKIGACPQDLIVDLFHTQYCLVVAHGYDIGSSPPEMFRRQRFR